MNAPDFVLGYLPFWIVNYGLALVMWVCVGRFLLSFFIAKQPNNYIWRGFRLVTDWAVWAVGWVTPRYVHPILLPPIAAFWLFYARVGAFALMWQWGWVPSITPAAS
jgi:hypothetical protein